MGKGMECSTIKDPLEGPFCCLVCSPLQLKKERLFPGSTTVEWSQLPSNASLTQPHCAKSPFGTTVLFPNRTLLPGDNRRPWTTRYQPCSSHSRSWLVDAQWKLEELLISPLRMSPFHVFFLLILVSSLSGDPRLWLMYVHYPSGKCCYQNSGFMYLLFHHCWVMHSQPYHLLSVLSWWSVYLF
jgi:hypothetical protein